MGNDKIINNFLSDDVLNQVSGGETSTGGGICITCRIMFTTLNDTLNHRTEYPEHEVECTFD